MISFYFGVDHTLARYKHNEVQFLIFDCMTSYLVEQKGYPADIFREYDPNFAPKGKEIAGKG